MSYTLRQVQPLLTKPELELFHASRAAAVKELTPRQLAGKITRARALRDKYRDTYRRQTVQTRTGPASARKPTGGENTRTEVKAEIMADLLQRFEAQQAKAEARLAKQNARESARVPRAPGAPATKLKPKAAQGRRRTTGNAGPGEGADLPMRGASNTKPRQLARTKRVVKDIGKAVVAARGAESTRAGGSSVRPAVKAPAKKAAAKAAPAKKAPAKKAAASKTPAAKKATSAKNAITGAARPAAKLVDQVRRATKQHEAQAPVEGAPRARRGIRARVGGSASDHAQGAVPTDMQAKAQRGNVLKEKPVNKKIHASARSRQKIHTAKRDSR